MAFFGDRKTKIHIKNLKPKYSLSAKKGEYSLHFDFDFPSSFIMKAAGKAFKIFKVEEENLDLMNEDSWNLSEMYHKKILKKICSWCDEVQNNTRSKHENNFTFVSQYIQQGKVKRMDDMYHIDILISGSYVD